MEVVIVLALQASVRWKPLFLMHRRFLVTGGIIRHSQLNASSRATPLKAVQCLLCILNPPFFMNLVKIIK